MFIHKQVLAKYMVRILIKMARASEPNQVLQIKDAGLDKTEYNNVSKLRHWGFVERTTGEHKKGGYWRVTHAGRMFLAGASKVPRVVWTWRGSVESVEQETTSVEEVTGGHRYWPDYASDARFFPQPPEDHQQSLL
jgi:hypothetical protein